MNKEVNWIKNTEGEITSCNITEEITIEQLKKSFLNEWKEEALKFQREEIVEEIEVEDVKLIQIAPVEFNSIACGRQTNLYGLDDKGRIWVKHYNHWDKWVLSEKDIFIKEETITKEDGIK